jgi:nitrogen fixation protein NifX
MTVDSKEQSMNSALRIAFASTDRRSVNQHFGSAEAFVIYQVTKDQAHLIEVVQFDKYEQDGKEDKLAIKFTVLSDCAAVYCQAVGASAIRQLMAKGIQPIKVSEGSEISNLIADLQAELQNGTQAWLTRIQRRQSYQDHNRFEQMAAEGWHE